MNQTPDEKPEGMTIREILEDCTETDYEYDGEDEVPVDRFDIDRAEQAIVALIEGIIGEDETDDLTDENTKPVHVDWPYRNELRAEQRHRLQQIRGRR